MALMNHGELYGVHLGGPPDRLVGALDSVFLVLVLSCGWAREEGWGDVGFP